MNATDIWLKVRHLFETDDGSLPDIFIQNLTDRQVVQIYNKVMEQSEIEGDPTLWSLEEEKDVPIKSVENPSQKFIEKKVDSFRHVINHHYINGVKIPTLSICVETKGVSFDYRMGNEWEEKQVSALFGLLSLLKEMAPNAKIFQANEGGYDQPSDIFATIFREYHESKHRM